MLASAVYISLIDAAIEAAEEVGIECPATRLWTHVECRRLFHYFGVNLIAVTKGSHASDAPSRLWRYNDQVFAFYNASAPLIQIYTDIAMCLYEIIATKMFPEECADDYWRWDAVNSTVGHLMPMIAAMTQEMEAAAPRLGQRLE